MTTQSATNSKQGNDSPQARGTRLLVGFDVFGKSEEALHRALAFATMFPHTQVDVAWIAPSLHVPLEGQPNPTVIENPESILRESVEKIVMDFGTAQLHEAKTKISLLTDQGDPVDALCRLAFVNEVDMIVVGSHDEAKGTLETLILGSTPKKLVEEAPCPVLVMRPRLTDAVPKIEAGLEKGEAKRTLGLPHRYTGVTRNQKSRENMPLFFPM